MPYLRAFCAIFFFILQTSPCVGFFRLRFEPVVGLASPRACVHSTANGGAARLWREILLVAQRRPPRASSVCREEESDVAGQGLGLDLLEGAVWKRALTVFGLSPRDVLEDAVKGSGHGGQKVNKTNNCCVLRAPDVFADDQEGRAEAAARDSSHGAPGDELQKPRGVRWIVVRCHSSR